MATHIGAVGGETICTSIIVTAALRFGAAKADSRKLQDRVDLILSALEVLPVEMPTDRHYATIRWQLTRGGTPIGPNDMLIARHALSEDLTVATANFAEFSRVPGLRVENWLAS